MRTKFTTDDRGVSEVIGAILVFGLLIALMAIMQTQAVPTANQEVEFKHHQEVQGDLIKFHERASQVVSSGSGRSIEVSTGTTYPTRLLFFSPGPPAGTIKTSDESEVRIENVEAENEELNQFLANNGNTLEGLGTRSITYRPNYHYYDDAPTTIFEYGILYNRFGDGDFIFLNEGGVVEDREINLEFAAGEYSETSTGSASLDIRPVSAPARPVTVRADGNEPMNITLPTQLSEEAWKELLDDQKHVVDGSVSVENGEVSFSLEPGVTYTLRMSQVGLERGIDRPEAEYIVPVGGDSIDVVQGGSGTVEFEVRDKYNNPVAGVNVSVDGQTQTTDSNGRVSQSVAASTGDTVTASIVDDCSEAWCSTEIDINVFDTSINPADQVVLEDSAYDPDVTFLGLTFDPGEYEGARLEFSSTGQTYEPQEMRISHYHRASDGEEVPTEAEISNEDDGSDSTTMEIGGSFEDISQLESIDDNGVDYYVAFNEGVAEGDFFIIEMVYSNPAQDGRESRSLYFISPDEE